MRLISRTIYRAFPELDRYTDAQCVRFVKSARGSWLRQAIGGLLIVVAVVGILFLGVILLFEVVDYQNGRFDPSRPPVRFGTLVGLAASIALITPGPLAGVLLRDWLLRRRVRFVLRSRGVCRSCWYSLVGLRVGADHRVRCPECGAEMEVDPSLGELATDAAGRIRFRPDADQLDLSYRFWNPVRRRRAKRAAGWLAGIALSAALLAAAAWEVFIRVQARQARAAIVGAAGVLEYVRRHQPAADPDAPDGWDAVVKAGTIRARIDRRVLADSPRTSRQQIIQPDFEGISDLRIDPKDDHLADDPASQQIARALARDLLAAYHAEGLWDALDEVRSRTVAVRPLTVPGGQTVFNASVAGEIGHVRTLTRICAAEMAEARRRSDLAAYSRALEAGLALVRVQRFQPFLIDGLVAVAMERTLLTSVETCLAEQPGAAWLEAIDAAMRRPAPDLPVDYHLKGERLGGRDAIATIFADPSKVRLGRFSPGLVGALGAIGGGGISPSLGTFRENVRSYERVFLDAAADLKTDPFQRTAFRPMAPRPPLIAANLTPALGAYIVQLDDLELRRRGVRTMLALERHRSTLGSYPASLSELIPSLLAAAPVDPWSGKSLVYRRLDDPADRSANDGRPYLLYSIGRNGRDDGGQVPRINQGLTLLTAASPDDIALNPPPSQAGASP